MARDKERPNLAAQWICVRSPFSRTGRVLERKAVQNIYAVREPPTKDFWTRSLPTCIFFFCRYIRTFPSSPPLSIIPSLLFNLLDSRGCHSGSSNAAHAPHIFFPIVAALYSKCLKQM